MDTQEVALEIVRIRNRLREIAGDHDDRVIDGDLVDEERELRKRMAELQGLLSDDAVSSSTRGKSDRDNGRYLPPV